MIVSKSEYKEYLRKEINITQSSNYIWILIKTYLKYQPNLRFLLLLRTCEYFKNCKKGVFNKFIYFLIKNHKYRLGLKLGFTIPENVAKKGLQLPHYGTIVINANTRIGINCRMHVCTNIGTANKSSIAPMIGDNVYIGPGVKIYGAIKIANHIKIAPNAAVSKDFLEEGVVIGGVPAKMLLQNKNKQ